jgi:hypothetical protein
MQIKESWKWPSNFETELRKAYAEVGEKSKQF